MCKHVCACLGVSCRGLGVAWEPLPRRGVSGSSCIPCASVKSRQGAFKVADAPEEDFEENERAESGEEELDEDLQAGARPELELITAGDVSLDMDVVEVENDDFDELE